MMFKVRADLRGAHYHVRVFAGPDRDHLALCGELRMRPEECGAFCQVLGTGAAYEEVPMAIEIQPPPEQWLREIAEGAQT